MSNDPHRGNLGEWSELYALGYLLVNGGAYEADKDQNPDPDIFHSVKQIWFHPSKGLEQLHFQLDNSHISILANSAEVRLVAKSQIEEVLERMIIELSSNSNRGTFFLQSGNQMMQILQKESVSAGPSAKETDLDLVFEELSSGAITPRVGFNIKSQIGARSTLLNASGATNFMYKIVSATPEHLARFPDFVHGKHRQNLKTLQEFGYKLEFHKIQSEVFQKNLTFLDMQFPAILAKVLLHSYITGENKFAVATQKVFPGTDLNSEQSRFKLKQFLGSVAMGLRPSTLWDGDTTKFSGMLVVKEKGEIVFNYLNKIKNFEEYLFNSVAFERPSTSRHKYGYIYELDGEHFLDLNLQIRFLK